LLHIDDLNRRIALARLNRIQLPPQLRPRPQLPLRLGRLRICEPLTPFRRFVHNLRLRRIRAVIEIEQRGKGADRERAPDRIGVGTIGQ